VKIGILGGGQLGRMLALAGHRLGFQFKVFDPDPNACAGQVTEHVYASYDDNEALARFATGLDVVTFEFENVPADTVANLAERVPIAPGSMALAATQDRCREKVLLRSLGMPTADFSPVDRISDLQRAASEIGLPCVVKTRRLGYDGKGQAVVHTMEQLEASWQQLGAAPCIVESYVPFERELSLIGVRDRTGLVGFSPWIENRHQAGILRVSLAPANPLDDDAARSVIICMKELMSTLEYVGVLAVEFFESAGELLANEIAPRVHNSGHWTIDGADTSQFENHLRAVAGLPVGSMTAIGHAGMVNLIGAVPPIDALLTVPGIRLHIYGKHPRPGRKVGHATVVTAALDHRDETLKRLQEIVARSTAD
jgi:5-(carboxyamino)imidazole ribonucleotide synthase